MGIALQSLGGLTALALAGAALAAGPAVTPTQPTLTAKWTDVDAIVSYETRQLTTAGVTRIETWQERLVRRGDQVWTERVLPAAVESVHARETVAEHHGHKHLNADTSARWLSLGAKGAVGLKLVDRENKVVVDVPAAEFGSVSFDGRYDAAATIVPPSIVKTMKAEGAPSSAGQWRSERNQGWSHRVLWSDEQQLALRVESRRDDGTIERKVSVKLVPPRPGQAVPWQALAGYTPKHYDEYMD